MQYPWAVPGRKVVCIADDWPFVDGEHTPVRNTTYTIRDVIVFKSGVGVRLNEIHNYRRVYKHPDTRNNVMGECAFIITCFRPLTDISIFEKMLKTKEVEKTN